MKHTRLLIVLIAAALAVSAGTPVASAATRVWEHIEASAPAGGAEGAAEGEVAVDVSVRDGYVYVTLSRRSPVKLFTILGQTVSQTELPAGTSRLRIPARGIYILRAGDSTVRITV